MPRLPRALEADIILVLSEWLEAGEDAARVLFVPVVTACNIVGAVAGPLPIQGLNALGAVVCGLWFAWSVRRGVHTERSVRVLIRIGRPHAAIALIQRRLDALAEDGVAFPRSLA